jgi:peptidoglycan/xylan/chitin deacetylase (PgdA/CDA1 family)
VAVVAAVGAQGSHTLKIVNVENKATSDAAGFTLSLDCEGLWGMADQANVVNAGLINDMSLKGAYATMLRTLDMGNLKVTAAFVTCFAAESDALLDTMPLLGQMAEHNPDWFSNVLPALRRGSFSGWNGANFYKSMSRAGHEMAWHGTTHLPLSTQTSSESVALELELATKLFRELGHTPKTIVFPRNQVGNLQQLHRYGFDTYRASLPSGLGNRLSGLLNEWNIFNEGVADKPCMQVGWNVSPAGNFLNWPSGVRAGIPISITVRRWKSLLRHAAETGGYVHMWFHPHNLITAPSMQIAFKEIMRFAGELVKSGDMRNLTMAEANEHYKSGVLL